MDVYHQPVKNAPYTLEVADLTFKNSTNDQGVLSHLIPSDAKKGKLTLDMWDVDLTIEKIDPADQNAGLRVRLDNLGFFAGGPPPQQSGERKNLVGAPSPGGEDESEQLRLALMRFQSAYGIEEADGQMNEATKAKLEEVYGG
jgi:hypothetical protein